MAQDSGIAIEIMSPDDLSDELIGAYYPMLSEKKKNEISILESTEDRCALLCAEIVARRALAELNGCEEKSIRMSCVPNGQSLVESGKGYLSVIRSGRNVCAVATEFPAGAGAVSVRSFRFAEAQQQLSDAEIRTLVSVSGYSLMDIVNAKSVSNQAATELYAQLCAMKNARLATMSDKLKKEAKKVSFMFENGEYICSDPAFRVNFFAISRKHRVAVAVVTKSE